MALREITDQTDLVLVVGDPQCSNSNRLREVAANRGIRAFLINNEHEIDRDWLENVKVIGLTAGASTPEGSCNVNRAYQRLVELGVYRR